jgi:hypothetical protein
MGTKETFEEAKIFIFVGILRFTKLARAWSSVTFGLQKSKRILLPYNAQKEAIMEPKTTILFIGKKSRMTRYQLLPIYLRVVFDGKRFDNSDLFVLP